MNTQALHYSIRELNSTGAELFRSFGLFKRNPEVEVRTSGAQDRIAVRGVHCFPTMHVA